MGLLADIAGALGTAAGGLGNLAGSAFTSIGQNLGKTGAGLLTGYGYNEMLEDLKAFGRDARTGADAIGQQAAAGTRFVPFTVTGATGAGVGTTPEGSTQFNLSPQEQALQNQLFGGAGQFYGQAQQPIAQTEQDIYNRMLQLAAPERERQSLALEERLAAQGRLGTSSAAYGGATPEQMALATAQQEQLNNLGLQARGQALSEQQQYANLGQGMLGAAYTLQSALLNVLNQGMGVAGLSDVGRRSAAQIQSEGQMAGLDAALQSELARGNLTGQGLAALAGALGGQQQAKTGLLGSATTGEAWDWLKSLL